jgi:hypothetical protein
VALTEDATARHRGMGERPWVARAAGAGAGPGGEGRKRRRWPSAGALTGTLVLHMLDVADDQVDCSRRL